MRRRIAGVLLDLVSCLTRSRGGWSILRIFPRSFRQYAKDLIHGTLYAAEASIPIVQSKVQLWNGDNPLLSVIVPCYKYGKYIRESLRSIRSQTLQDYEIIVVDDGSTDPLTLHVLEELQQEGVKVLRQEHSGPAIALNRGIAACSGKYVCCLSADDTVEPTYFEKCVALLESNPGLSFAYSLVKAFGYERRVGVTKPFDLRLLLAYNHVCGSAVFLKAAWQAVGGFDASMPAYEDWDFWIRLGKNGFRGRLIPEPLFNWRRHSQTFGRRVDQSRPDLMRRLRENHAELFSDPAQIDRIQDEYRDFRVTNPFLNIASKNQYAQSKVQKVLVICSGTRETPELAYDALKQYDEQQITTIIIATSSLSYESDSMTAFGKASNLLYNLPTFLEPCYWRDFTINLINTRAIQLVLICRSSSGYEWMPEIKEQTPASIRIIQN